MFKFRAFSGFAPPCYGAVQSQITGRLRECVFICFDRVVCINTTLYASVHSIAAFRTYVLGFFRCYVYCVSTVRPFINGTTIIQK